MRERRAGVPLGIPSYLFGGSCFVSRGAARTLLGAQCDAGLPRLGASLCPRCALDSPEGAVSGRCLTQSPAYDATHAALAYDFPADAVVHALKFRGELALAPLLVPFLADRVLRAQVDHGGPVPLSVARHHLDVDNQAFE